MDTEANDTDVDERTEKLAQIVDEMDAAMSAIEEENGNAEPNMATVGEKAKELRGFCDRLIELAEQAGTPAG